MTARPVPAVLDRRGYELEVEDRFDRTTLDERLWSPRYLPHWTSPDRAAARYETGDGSLRLRIDQDQPAWSPEWTGGLRVSSLQTGARSGPLGGPVGQHRFRDDLVVRSEHPDVALYTPRYGLFELRARAIADPTLMAALWMIGVEDEPEHSAEICICEIFGRDVGSTTAKVGMGVHPFGDPAIRDDFAAETVAIDATEPHTYAAVWEPERVAFYVDDRLIRIVEQSPTYPMQFMLDVYEFADGPEPPSAADAYPKVFVVDWFRGWRPVSGRGARLPAFAMGSTS